MNRDGRRRAASHRDPLRAAGIGDHGRLSHVFGQLIEEEQVLPHRRRQDDEVGLGEDEQIVGRHVDRVQPHRRFEHVLAVDGNDERRRPDAPGGQRDRTADETQPDDPDLGEDRRLSLGEG